jgi:urea transport system permease protein
VDTFMVVVVGGVGKLVGSIVAAGAIGTASYVIGSNAFKPFFDYLLSVFTVPLFQNVIKTVAGGFEFFSGATMAKVMVFILIIVFLQFRPSGLFPQKGRTVDA